MKLLIVATFLSITAPTFANDYKWETPRRDNCRGDGVRQYTSTIKLLADASISDSDWMYNCMRTSANINGREYLRPTRCQLSIAGLPRVGEFDLLDPSCDIDYFWLWEKVGKIIGKTFICLPTGEKLIFDGCTVPFSDSVSILGKDYLNAACVAHDLCYATPASLGITKAKCDQMMHDLALHRCKEVNNKDCLTSAAKWYSIPIRDWRLDGWKLSQTSYDERQHQFEGPNPYNPCRMSAVQGKNTLYQGSQMGIGAVRWSPDGRKLLVLLSDGNLVLYDVNSSGEVGKIWSSNTPGLGVVKAIMQRDGNFVLYTKDNEARWHTGTDNKPTNFLMLQDRNDLYIYSMGSPTVQWSSQLNGGYLIPMSTNLRTESLNSMSIEDIGTMTMQEAFADTPQVLSDTPVDIVYIDHDPHSAPGHASNRDLDGFN
jgi:hypothetical protein